MKKLIGTAAAIAVALAFSAPVAQAGVYVSGPLPSEFAGGYVPSDPDLMKAMGKGQKEGAKLAGGISKCYSKGAGNVAKGKPSGVSTCLHDPSKGVIPKYLAKVATISPTAPCGLGGPAASTAVGSIVKSFNGLLYCQSPSGAFLDGSTF